MFTRSVRSRLLIGISTLCVGFCALFVAPANADSNSKVLPASDVTRMIRRAERNVADAKGWAADILASLSENDLAQNRQNICSVVAVVDQESGFVANPKVPGLGALAYKAVTGKLDKLPGLGEQIKAFLEKYPTPEASYVEMIRSAETERDLDLAFRHVVSELSTNLKLGFLLNTKYFVDVIENLNKVATLGSMQTSVQFAISVQEEKLQRKLTLDEINTLRDFMYTRKGGLLYGTLLLLGYKAGYSDKAFLFADFNAGRYSSRNAAFQSVIGKLSGADLALDGDLLIYDRGEPAKTVGKTEIAIRQIASGFALGLTDEQIRTDILNEKLYSLVDTQTYRAISGLYRRQVGAEPPFAIIPVIDLSSIKLSHKMTTRSYAERVKRRYNACLKS